MLFNCPATFCDMFGTHDEVELHIIAQHGGVLISAFIGPLYDYHKETDHEYDGQPDGHFR